MPMNEMQKGNTGYCCVVCGRDYAQTKTDRELKQAQIDILTYVLKNVADNITALKQSMEEE